MDKRNQMENPFFDPDKPGSIFVGMVTISTLPTSPEMPSHSFRKEMRTACSANS